MRKLQREQSQTIENCNDTHTLNNRTMGSSGDLRPGTQITSHIGMPFQIGVCVLGKKYTF